MSRETDAIISYLDALGVSFRVTAILGRYVSPANPCSPHTANSLHCAEATGGRGLAVDLAGVTPGTGVAAVQQMGAIFNAFRPVAPKLAELFHNGPGIDKVIKNGVWRSGYATLGRQTWAAHKTHVHVAVPRGTFLVPPAPAAPASVPAHAETVPVPVHDYTEATTKTTMIHIGKLDEQGNGWADWQPGLGRDPIIVGLVQLGPSPQDDGYWSGQAKVNLSAQPRGGAVRVVVRNGTPGDTVTAFLTVA